MHGLVSTTINSSQQESCRQQANLNTRYHLLLPLLSCGHPPHNMSIKRFIEGRYKNTWFLTFHGTSFNAHACVVRDSGTRGHRGPALIQFHTRDFLVRLFWPVIALFTCYFHLALLELLGRFHIMKSEFALEFELVLNEINTNCKNNFEYIVLIRIVNKLIKQ